MNKPKVPVSLEEAGNYFSIHDDNYVHSWIQESAEWGSQGIYDVINNDIELSPGDNHIDLGSGLGQVIIRLKQENPDAHIAGVEKNSSLVVANAGIAETQDPPLQVRVLHNEHYIREGDECISRRYIPPGEDEGVTVNDGLCIQNRHLVDNYAYREDIIFRPESTILIVIDDIRSMQLLKKIIGNNKFDSGSFTFPGSSTSTSVEYPHKFDNPDANEKLARMLAIMKETRRAAYRFMSERIKHGKFFVTAERMLIPDSEQSMEELALASSKHLAQLMGEYRKYWDLNKMAVCRSEDDKKPESRLAWVTPDNGETITEGFVMICKLQRNDIPFAA